MLYEEELALEEALGVRHLELPKRSLFSLLTSPLHAGTRNGRELLAPWAAVLQQFDQLADYERVTCEEHDHAQLQLLLLLRLDEITRTILLPDDYGLLRSAATRLKAADADRGGMLEQFLAQKHPIMAVVEALLAAVPLLPETDVYLAWLRRRLDGPTMKMLRESPQAERFKALRNRRNRSAHPPYAVTCQTWRHSLQEVLGRDSVGVWLVGSTDHSAGLLDALLRGLILPSGTAL